MRTVVLVCGLLLAGTAQAGNGIDGWGRISVGGGVRWVPNWWFVDHAAMAGTPVVEQMPVGPQGVLSFGYGVSQWLEVSVDVFGGWEAFALQGLDGQKLSYSSFTGAAMLGGRLVGRDLFGKGVSPWLSVQGGGLFTAVSGPNIEITERLLPSFAAGGGVDVRFADRYGVSFDVRYLHGRSYVPPVSGINVGGVWFTVSFVIYFPPEPKQDLAVPGF